MKKIIQEKIIQKIVCKIKQLNNNGMTMTEMIVCFALLALFMVSASRMISYTVGIYYAAAGATRGLEVSSVISQKIVGQIEGAKAAKNPIVSSNGEFGAIEFVDATGSEVAITVEPQLDKESNIKGNYMVIKYREVTEGSVKYNAVDWRFDSKAYMGYEVSRLTFEDPDKGRSEDLYPDNVLKMTLVLHSDRYGDYTSTEYIKCVNVETIVYQ